MKSKRFSILITAVVVLVAMLIIPLAGCEGEVSVTTASLSEATVCKSVNPQTQEPGEKTDVFPPNAEVFYCSVKLSNAPANTEVSAQWIFVQGEIEEKNVLIDETSITTDGTRYVGFSLTHDPSALWPKGDYIVKLFLDGKEKITMPFRVQ
mgnify:CR=1 FL=1